MFTVFRYWITFILLTTLCLSGIYAGGQREDRLETARKLMEEKKYNEATALLSQLSQEEPDRFDQADELLREIRVINTENNKIFRQSLEAIANGNLDEALALLNQSEALIPNPNSATAKDQKILKKTINFNVSLQRYNALMTDAKAFLDREAWGQAAAKYLEGYNYQRQEFDEADYGNILKTQVLASLADLQAAGEEFIAREAEFRKIQAQGVSILNSTTPDLINAQFQTILDSWNALANLKLRIVKASLVFQRQYDLIIQAKGIDEKDFFLEYNIRVTRGRLGVAWDEGLYNSIELFWEKSLESWDQVFKERVGKTLAKAEADWTQGQWDSAGQNFQQAYELSLLAAKTLGTWNTSLLVESKDKDIFSFTKFKAPLSNLWYYQTMGALAGQGKQSAASELALSKLSPQDLTTEKSISDARIQMAQVRSVFTQFSTDLDQKAKNFIPFQPPGWNLEGVPLSLGRFKQYWQVAIRNLNSQEINLIYTLGGLEYEPLALGFGVLESNQGQINLLLTGKDPQDYQRFPLQALSSLQEQAPLHQDLKTKISAYIEKYQKESVSLGNPKEIEARVKEGQALLDKINALILQQTLMVQDANGRIKKYQDLRKEAESLRISAISAVDGGRFTAARQDLKNYQTSAAQSLTIQTDPVYEQLTNKNFADLQNYLNTEENKLVVKDVTSLLVQARDAYNNQKFNQAEDLLNRAETRWKVTNADDNSEVSKWQSNVKSALSGSGNRELLVTDPLYMEIQQLLNFASQSLARAERLPLSDKAGRGALLKEAAGYVNRVKLVFALNQEARVLGLKIELVQDPGNRVKILEDFFNSALTSARSNIQANQIKGFQELQDLQKLDAEYPGLKTALKNVQIALGYIQPDANPADIRESRNLTNSAKAIYDTGSVSKYPIAITQLTRALKLDPSNYEAQGLKITLDSLTGRAAVIISISDQVILDKVYDLIEANNLRQARIQFSRLDVNGRYKDLEEIIKLKQRLTEQ